MPTHPAPSWCRLKPHLDRLDTAALVGLLRDLYALNADNKVLVSLPRCSRRGWRPAGPPLFLTDIRRWV